VNSRFTDHTGTGQVYDRLEIPAWRAWFADRCGLSIKRPPAEPQRRELIQLRELMRDLLESGREPDSGEIRTINRYLALSPHVWELSRQGPDLEIHDSRRVRGWRAAMATVALSYCDLLASGEIDHVRRCANPDCTWLFFDHSRNRSRRWCDPARCGNLDAVRRHRAAHTSGAG
jgi:predicted RNA-binding Zn ribbon-like protein